MSEENRDDPEVKKILDARPAAAVPEGVTLISSGSAEGIEVSTQEWDERGAYAASLATYIRKLTAKLEPLENGLPTEAVEIFEILQAARYLATSAQELSDDLTTQASTALLLPHHIITAVSGVSPTSITRRVRNEPRVDFGEFRRGRNWRDVNWEKDLPNLPTPPEIPPATTYVRKP